MSPPDGKPAIAPAPAPSNRGVSATGANLTTGGANITGAATSGRGLSLPSSTAVPPPPASAPRSRNQGGRKKMIPIEPDSLYRGAAVSTHGSSTQAQHAGIGGGAGSKRGTDSGGPASTNEPRKRKRVDAQHLSASTTLTHSKQSMAGGMHSHSHGYGGLSGRGGGSSGMGSAITGAGGTNLPNSQTSNNINGASNGIGFGTGLGGDGDAQSSLIEFSTLPTSALYEYISQHDLVPVIYPSPLSAEDPPPPAALLDPARMAIASRAPTPTPLVTPMMMNQQLLGGNPSSSGGGSRPRRSREAKEISRRRSTRLLEEELRGAGGGGLGVGGIGMEQVPLLADVSAVHGVLATIAARHFRESSVSEMDTLTSFLSAAKARR